MTSPTSQSHLSLFPVMEPHQMLAFQFSSWYPRFASLSIKSTVVRPLGQEFLDYLNADGVFMPEGAEDLGRSTASDEDDHSDDEVTDETARRKFAFPQLDAKIRETVQQYGAVFPKLNFSSPRDAAWILPAGSPMKCMSPSDVYMLLKSSDFVLHDIDPMHVFEGCMVGSGELPEYSLELVLRKWYSMDRSREVRCFVRQEILLGISQRDSNYYYFWNETETQNKVIEAIQTFWEDKIKGQWESADGNYVFDVLLTRDFSRGHIIDFNPFAPKTDPHLFTYEELMDLLDASSSSPTYIPKLRVVNSPRHPAATRNTPLHQHNMLPIEALILSHGRNAQEFAEAWQQELYKSATTDEV